MVADDGTTTSIKSAYDADGSLQSRVMTVADDTGLTVTTSVDRDGDGTYERVTEAATVLGADGSVTKTVETSSDDGTVHSQTITVISDDGLQSTRTEDWNNDGSIDRTTNTTSSLATDGVETLAVIKTAADGSLLSSVSQVTSADRQTVTVSTDSDGNGVDDSVTVTSVADDGAETASTNYYSTGGTLQAVYSSTVSGDGLTRVQSTDRNGDGTADVISTTTTTLGTDGSVTRDVEHRSGLDVLLAGETHVVSDDGLTRSVSLDIDGDTVVDFATTQSTVFDADGDIVRTQTTNDGSGNLLSNIVATTSGDGLLVSVSSDTDGDGVVDKTSVLTLGADGARSQTSERYDSSETLLRSTTTQVSADGWTTAVETDLDGDGFVDWQVSTLTDDDRNVTTTFQELATDGTAETEIVKTQSANGISTSYAFDLDADGSTDLSRSTDISYDMSGNKITTFTESADDNTFYQEITTAAADGLSATTTYDVDGDGSIDGTKTSVTTLNDDGSRETISETYYESGELRSKDTVTVSADGRTITETHDYDGNGIADKTSEIVIATDGSRVETVTTYNQAGRSPSTSVITTTADGLETTIVRSDVVQTISRSAVDNGSYDWDNGESGTDNIVVSHDIDGLGIETWSYTGGDGTTEELRLDAAAKQLILTEAARIYDTVLDRDMDWSEAEVLITFAADGQLDQAALVTELLESAEFATRYGTQTDGEFVTQMYLNTYGRGPSLGELDSHLTDLDDGSQTRADLLASTAQSIEHVVIGNGHRSTNNFDVILNPASYERSLDEAYLLALVESIVDVVYDRDATAHELEYLSGLLSQGTDNPDDIADLLLTVEGDIQGVSSASLYGLSGTALVKQAFQNAFGRDPSTSEIITWYNHLVPGADADTDTDFSISTGQFIVALAQSVEYLSVGNAHLTNAAPSVTTTTGSSSSDTKSGGDGQDIIYGLAGEDKLIGYDGSDILVGGTDDDTLKGDDGSDIYIWALGDGSDTINDKGESLIETDRLILSDVASDEVALTRSDGSKHLYITMTATGEAIKIKSQYNEGSEGKGIEIIEFSDGVIWTLEDIQANTITSGTSGVDELDGYDFGENIYGLAGNDKINGNDGDDVISGGLGDDTLDGGAGSDSYIWAKGDGDDTINDTDTSLTDVDRLILSDVTADGVELTRANGSDDLLLSITATGEIITITNQYNDTSKGYGIEVIEFSDGEIWAFADILANTTLTGTAGDDTIVGKGFQDNIYGLGGADTIDGNGGDDVITGGLGDDILRGGAGSDTYIWAIGDGNDTITETTASLTSIDRLILSDVASDEVELTQDGISNDIYLKITSSGEVITLTNQLTAASDGKGIEVIEFSDGIAWSVADILSQVIALGTSGDDVLLGTSGDDIIDGGAGNDDINGSGGDDTITGGLGDDTLTGGKGDDTFIFNRGDGMDVIDESIFSVTENGVTEEVIGADDFTGVTSTEWTGGKNSTSYTEIIWTSDSRTGATISTVEGGEDTLQFGDGITIADLVVNTDGDDVTRDLIVELEPEDDGGVVEDSVTITNWGTDEFKLEAFEFADGFVLDVSDIYYAETGSDGADTLVAGVDHDGDEASSWLAGGDGDDTITGSDQADILIGGDGADEIAGGKGADIIFGGAGADILTGNKGDDVFQFTTGDGVDTITDFDRSDDLIGFFDTDLVFADLTITDVTGGASISYGAGDQIIVEGLKAADFSSDDFLFV